MDAVDIRFEDEGAPSRGELTIENIRSMRESGLTPDDIRSRHLRYSSPRSYRLTCAGCGYSMLLETGPFELGGAACARCGSGVEVNRLP